MLFSHLFAPKGWHLYGTRAQCGDACEDPEPRGGVPQTPGVSPPPGTQADLQGPGTHGRDPDPGRIHKR